MIGRNTYGYGSNINCAKFYERLEQAKQFFEGKYDKEGGVKHPVLYKKAKTERFKNLLSSPSEEHHPKE